MRKRSLWRLTGRGRKLLAPILREGAGRVQGLLVTGRVSCQGRRGAASRGSCWHLSLGTGVTGNRCTCCWPPCNVWGSGFATCRPDSKHPRRSGQREGCSGWQINALERQDCRALGKNIYTERKLQSFCLCCARHCFSHVHFEDVRDCLSQSPGEGCCLLLPRALLSLAYRFSSNILYSTLAL